MKEKKVQNIIETLKDMLYQYDFVLKGYKEREKVKLALLTCESVPREILHTMGYIPIGLPASAMNKECFHDAVETTILPEGLYDIIIVPEGCLCRNYYDKDVAPVITFRLPPGYGEEHSIAFHEETERVKQELKGKDYSYDINRLQDVADEYNIIRRLLRGITAQRRGRSHILPYSDMTIIFEALSVFPPALIIEYAHLLSRVLQEVPAKDITHTINTVIYTSYTSNDTIFNDIEREGFLIVEDDSCNGKRLFDISVNAESDYVYYELLDACSYRPLCPSKRSQEERYELFYKMMKNYDIEVVIFIEDYCCGNKKKHIDFLRKKLMRSGIDPIVASSNNVIDVLKSYKKNAGIV